MIRIGGLQVDFAQREICRDGEMLRVGSRALAVLRVLIDADGGLVSKDDLMRHVWPDTFVEENNLQVQIAWLRKTLGADRDLIKTIPGRGYQLVASHRADHAPGRIRMRSQQGLLAHASKLVGRDATVCEIAGRLGEVPELTLVGAGGIGKTRLALEVAERMSERFRDGVYFVELAALSDTTTVLAAVAEVCGTPFAYRAASAKQIAQTLAHTQCLIVLDNAEHVIEAIANLVCELSVRAPDVRVLVTSREPLRVGTEALFRVQPLAVPDANASTEEVLANPAVELFLSRARAMDGNFGVDAQCAQLMGGICRRLDGIALAIELAAARAAALGVEGVYSLLDDRLQLLTGGQRQSLPRHQTLRATFDWSYALLDPVSRAVFRRIGIFAGAFTLESACAVATCSHIPSASLVARIGDLVEKSLLNVDVDAAVARYRLTESTRAYAIDRLRDEGEFQRIAQRHAEFLQARFQHEGVPDAPVAGKRDLPSELYLQLDDARGAIDRAFATDGDARLGVELAGAVVDVLLGHALIEECCTCAARAVEVLETLPRGSVDTGCELRLRAALAITLLHTRGLVGRATELWREVLSLAVDAGDEEFQKRALWGLWNTMLASADIHASLRYATRFQQLVTRRGDDAQRILGSQLLAVSLHCFGEHQQARERLEYGLAERAVHPVEVRLSGRFAVDPLVISKATLALVLWIQGQPDEALRQVRSTVDLVRAEALEASTGHVMVAATVPLVLMSGELDAAVHCLEVLRSQVPVHRLSVWNEYCESLDAQVDIMSGQVESGLARLGAALHALLERGFRYLLTPSITLYAETLAGQGRTVDAMARLDAALAYCTAQGEHFFVPEIWRVMGLIALQEAHFAQANARLRESHELHAQRCLLRAIQIAREHGARMWELRASLVLARLLQTQGRRDDALSLLKSLAAQFDARCAATDVRQLYALLSACAV